MVSLRKRNFGATMERRDSRNEVLGGQADLEYLKRNAVELDVAGLLQKLLDLPF